ncbi:hypothetical protein XENORESO_014462 [Xenotaenia resolanae]|uniref:Uncharacterized protein n=1 Tax=Xenotaenia resolanae TaxID=208358 RepID=A0ABV0VQV4_9TELE
MNQKSGNLKKQHLSGSLLRGFKVKPQYSQYNAVERRLRVRGQPSVCCADCPLIQVLVSLLAHVEAKESESTGARGHPCRDVVDHSRARGAFCNLYLRKRWM